MIASSRAYASIGLARVVVASPDQPGRPARQARPAAHMQSDQPIEAHFRHKGVVVLDIYDA